MNHLIILVKILVKIVKNQDYEEGFVDGYNKAKENYEVVSSIRELHQYKIGLEDGYNKAKETLLDAEIEKGAEKFKQSYLKFGVTMNEVSAWMVGATWCREQLKLRQ